MRRCWRRLEIHRHHALVGLLPSQRHAVTIPGKIKKLETRLDSRRKRGAGEGLDVEVTRREENPIIEKFKAVPDSMRAFRGLMESAGKDGELDSKTKELMALAVGIAVHCEGCINYHTREAIRKGATRGEVAETAAVAIEMGGGPSAVYGAQALDAFDQLSA